MTNFGAGKGSMVEGGAGKGSIEGFGAGKGSIAGLGAGNGAILLAETLLLDEDFDSVEFLRFCLVA